MGPALAAGAGRLPVGPVQLGVGSAKGSPGATTVATAVSLVWPGQVLLGDLDPAGGDMVGRLRLMLEPGAATLAAVARHGLTWDLLVEHTQALTSTCRVLVGRPGRALSGGTARLLAGDLPGLARKAGVAGVWDLGRLEPGSAAWPAAGACDVVVLVARPTADDLAHVVPLAEEMIGAGMRLGLALVSPRRARRGYRNEEVAVALSGRLSLHAPPLARVPWDPLGVSFAERVMPRWAGRCALGAAARQLVDAVGPAAPVGNGVPR